MASEGIDIYIIPTSDFHQSEYVSDYFKCREFMSGFTGSAGTLLVTDKNAGLWTDGRYFLQAEEQLEGSGIELFRSGNEGVPTIIEYVEKEFREFTQNTDGPFCIGFDGRVTDTAFGLKLEETLSKCSAMTAAETSSEGASSYTIKYDSDLVDRLWDNRPALPANPIYSLSEDFTGRSTADKLTEIRKYMKENNCDFHLLTSLDDIAWLLNMRGSDVACNPVFLSYLLIGLEEVTLFCNIEALEKEAALSLNTLGISIQPYNGVYSYCSGLISGSRVLLDSDHVNYSLYSILSHGGQIVNKPNPSTMLKSRKNNTEIENLRLANLKDGVAMVKFLAWLDSANGNEPLTEVSVAEKLLEFRKEKNIKAHYTEAAGMKEESRQVYPDLSEVDFLDISFDTISGYGAHGAIVHYEPTPESDIPVESKGFLLVDSGAQYRQGTTDITRTIAMGPLTEEMKKHYTAVLRGNLALASAVFPAGTAGANLDILARKPLWDLRLDYNHGTGHGIGYFLNVHEGPQSFHWRLGSRKGNTVPLEPGMVITDEPGVYITGSHGIRTENDLLVIENSTNEFGKFYSFEVLTLCPIDKRPIIPEELTCDERAALNAYHRHVFESLSPYLDENERSWLKEATEEI